MTPRTGPASPSGRGPEPATCPAFLACARANDSTSGVTGSETTTRCAVAGTKAINVSRSSRPSDRWMVAAPSTTSARRPSRRSREFRTAASRSEGVAKRMSERSGEAQGDPRAATACPVAIASRPREVASAAAAAAEAVSTTALGVVPSASTRSSRGAPYATSVPLPGPARTSALLPRRRSGTTFRCSGVGRSMPSAARGFHQLRREPEFLEGVHDQDGSPDPGPPRSPGS